MDPSTMFGLNMYFLIGLLLAVAIVLALIIAICTALKIWLWRNKRLRAEREVRQVRYRPDGQLYPPASRGLCDRCSQAYDKVYHLPSGKRLCPDCYASAEGAYDARPPKTAQTL